jgi:hypothetical protein
MILLINRNIETTFYFNCVHFQVRLGSTGWDKKSSSNFGLMFGTRETLPRGGLLSAFKQNNPCANRIEFRAILVMCAVNKEPWKLKKRMYTRDKVF